MTGAKIDFEVTGMHDCAHRSLHRQAETVRNIMIHAEKFNEKIAQFDFVGIRIDDAESQSDADEILRGVF